MFQPQQDTLTYPKTKGKEKLPVIKNKLQQIFPFIREMNCINSSHQNMQIPWYNCFLRVNRLTDLSVWAVCCLAVSNPLNYNSHYIHTHQHTHTSLKHYLKERLLIWRSSVNKNNVYIPLTRIKVQAWWLLHSTTRALLSPLFFFFFMKIWRWFVLYTFVYKKCTQIYSIVPNTFKMYRVYLHLNLIIIVSNFI